MMSAKDYKPKKCLRCDELFKPASGVQRYCSPCRRPREFEQRADYRGSNRKELCAKQRRRWQLFNEAARNSKLKSKYGITLAQYREQVARQNGCCAICRRPRKLVVDHCHRREVFRGLLCRDCNIALGGFFDSPQSLFSAFVYICRANGLNAVTVARECLIAAAVEQSK